MGCGSSGNVVPSQDDSTNDQGKMVNGNGHHDDDDLPTVVLPESPIKPKPPIAFEIPVEEFDSSRRSSNTPPAHLQRLLQPPQPDITLPDIEEKLAVAEQRRLSLLQQRAASAQKRTQKMLRSAHAVDATKTELESTDINKHVTNTLTIPPEPGLLEDKTIR
ncbi:uncharacterized protein LOC110385069 [Bombyx mori]|uniref:Uncharacterized protein n=1 Tax=Bombyx mori TaxID=7091 RepID=A0A8R2R4K0_BOMMO|nr:uncharacterized protein LOC110385069 [Bombyx mori]XP_021203224.1 uncharacterized protein LOC110385069 [Bombyx mori]XP_037875483.1 uncharacterized protein LOC110385069 [Bombyx mori]XP_037875484.1 uncharacterized protein LOC110385069 [Bombyx mori]